MATFTVLSGTASAATTPTRVKPISGSSPSRSRQKQNFSGLGTAYRALSASDKASWQAAANTLNTMQARVGRHKLSASNAFNLCNSGRLAVDLAILSTAPEGAAFAMPPTLPDILVNASSVAGRFSLTLTPRSGSVSNPVQILACPPQVAGKTTWPDKSFSPIGFVAELEGGANDISEMFTAKFGVPEAGYEICLRLVSTSESGLRRGYVLVTGFCSASQAAVLPGSDSGEGTALRAA